MYMNFWSEVVLVILHFYLFHVILCFFLCFSLHCRTTKLHQTRKGVRVTWYWLILIINFFNEVCGVYAMLFDSSSSTFYIVFICSLSISMKYNTVNMFVARKFFDYTKKSLWKKNIFHRRWIHCFYTKTKETRTALAHFLFCCSSCNFCFVFLVFLVYFLHYHFSNENIQLKLEFTITAWCFI